MSIHVDALRDIAAMGWPACDEAADELESCEKAYALLFKENATLRQQLAEARRNEARYRWLRDENNLEADVSVPNPKHPTGSRRYFTPTGNELDAAIDAQLAALAEYAEIRERSEQSKGGELLTESARGRVCKGAGCV